MKIACPNCNAAGSIPEHDIPEEGRFLNCPRCKHGFTVTKPRNPADSFHVDTCPACNFSTFGEDRFATCPKCGVVVKTYTERQREEQQRMREHELLNKKHARDEREVDALETVSPVAEFVDKLHPVNLVGWGCGLAAVVILGLGVWGLLDYSASAIKAQILAERDEQVSTLYVFAHHGFLPLIKLLYGVATLITAYYFLQHKTMSLKLLTILLRVLLLFIPLNLVVSFLQWVLQPIPHSIGAYFVELINIVFMSALFCGPLFLLERFLKDKRIVSVVKL